MSNITFEFVIDQEEITNIEHTLLKLTHANVKHVA